MDPLKDIATFMGFLMTAIGGLATVFNLRKMWSSDISKNAALAESIDQRIKHLEEDIAKLEAKVEALTAKGHEAEKQMIRLERKK